MLLRYLPTCFFILAKGSVRIITDAFFPGFFFFFAALSWWYDYCLPTGEEQDVVFPLCTVSAVEESPIISRCWNDLVAQSGMHLIIFMIYCIIPRMFQFVFLSVSIQMEKIQNKAKAHAFSLLGGVCRIQEEWHMYNAMTPPAVSLLALSQIQSPFSNPSFVILLFIFYCPFLPLLLPSLAPVAPGNSSSGVNWGARPLPSHSGVRRTVMLWTPHTHRVQVYRGSFIKVSLVFLW